MCNKEYYTSLWLFVCLFVCFYYYFSMSMSSVSVVSSTSWFSIHTREPFLSLCTSPGIWIHLIQFATPISYGRRTVQGTSHWVVSFSPTDWRTSTGITWITTCPPEELTLVLWNLSNSGEADFFYSLLCPPRWRRFWKTLPLIWMSSQRLLVEKKLTNSLRVSLSLWRLSTG